MNGMPERDMWKICVCLILLVLTGFSCRSGPVRREVRSGKVCQDMTPGQCLEYAVKLEEQGHAAFLEAYEEACAAQVSQACERLVMEVEMVLFPAPTPLQMDAWIPRLESLCGNGQEKACWYVDLLIIHKLGPDNKDVRPRFFRMQEACRKQPESCVVFTQALQVLSRKKNPLFDANALTGYRTACEGGIGEACIQSQLLMPEKRDLPWLLSYLLKGCKLGEVAGCEQLAVWAKRAIIEDIPGWKNSAPFLEKACHRMESRNNCLLFAQGHIHAWWTDSDVAIGEKELFRQCGLGSEEACNQLAALLEGRNPKDQELALQIWQQGCSEGSREACVRLAESVRRAGAPKGDQEAFRIARMACLGSQYQVQTEYYDRHATGQILRNISCALMGRFLVEGTGVEKNVQQGERMMQQGCVDGAHPVCLYYAAHLRRAAVVNAAGVTGIYERVCMGGHGQGCFEMAEYLKTGYKELKPDEAQSRVVRKRACRLEPGDERCRDQKE